MEASQARAGVTLRSCVPWTVHRAIAPGGSRCRAAAIADAGLRGGALALDDAEVSGLNEQPDPGHSSRRGPLVFAVIWFVVAGVLLFAALWTGLLIAPDGVRVAVTLAPLGR